MGWSKRSKCRIRVVPCIAILVTVSLLATACSKDQRDKPTEAAAPASSVVDSKSTPANGCSGSGNANAAQTSAVAPSASRPDGLVVVDNPILEVAADGTAASILRICNSGGTGQTLDLGLGNFRAKRWDSPDWVDLGATPSLTVKSGDDSTATKSGDALPAGECRTIHLTASRLSSTDLMTSLLTQKASPLAQVVAFKVSTPFHVHIDGQNPDKLELRVSRNEVGLKPHESDAKSKGSPTPEVKPKGTPTTDVKIANDDPIAYGVEWQLEIGDLVVDRGCQMIGPGRKATLHMTFGDDEAGKLFAFFDSGFISPNRKEGRLLLTRFADGPMRSYQMESRPINVAATLSYFTPSWEAIANGFWIFIILVLGVLTSLGLNSALPMQRKKVGLKQALAVQERSLNGQGALIGSRTLNTLRLELSRLKAAVQHQIAFFPEAETEFTALEVRIKALGQRIDITRSASRYLDLLRTGHFLALSEAEIIGAHCHEALGIVEMASPSDVDLQKAQAFLAQSSTLIDASKGAPDAATVSALSKRRQGILDTLASKGSPLGGLPSDPSGLSEAPLPEKVPPVVEADPAGAPAEPPPQSEDAKNWADLVYRLEDFRDQWIDSSTPSRQEYVDDSKWVWRAEMLLGYAYLVKRSETPRIYRQRLARAKDLLDSLQPGPSYSPESTLRIMKEIAQNVAKPDIMSALQPLSGGPVPRIEISPPNPMEFQITDFRIVFPNIGLNTAEALSSINCKWTVNGEELESRGFSVYYFIEQKPWLKRGKGDGNFAVAATVDDGKSGIALGPVPLKLARNKEFVSSVLALSVVSFAATIFIITVGLIAAAQEKLQSVDALSGCLVLFGLGFGVDAVKRALSKT
jgi:hypothetical protein